MVALQARHGGVWKDAEPYVKRAGAWIQPDEVWAKEAGVWTKVWPSIVARAFSISPAVSGKSTWDLDVDGPLTLVAAGTWTITPLATFLCSVEMWGGGGGGGGAGSTSGSGGSGGSSTIASLVAGGGSAGGNGVNNPGSLGSGGIASGGDINQPGEDSAREGGSITVSGYGGASPSGGNRAAGRSSVGSGSAGNAPGGGGAGGFNGAFNHGGGGGGGARCKKDALSVSTQVTLTVGSGGAGGSALRLGGTGADGKVVIS